MTDAHQTSAPTKAGFSLVEVVLAIGIFLVTILALVGLLGPTLKSVERIETVDEVSSVVNTINSFLQSSPDIARAGETSFETIYNAVAANDYAQLFVFRAYRSGDPDTTDIVVKIGFESSEPVNPDSHIKASDFGDAAGPIYRVILSPSSTIPLRSSSTTPTNYFDSYATLSSGEEIPERSGATKTYILSGGIKNNVAAYLEGYFSMEVRIYAENPGPLFDQNSLPPRYSVGVSLDAIADLEPVFTYNAAIVR
ncbi:MAG: PulJ/GspJ family protein [Lentimonas sp.]